MRLDYVVSGTSYMRLSNPRIATNDTTVEIVKMLINKLVQDKHNHKFKGTFKNQVKNLEFQKERRARLAAEAENKSLKHMTDAIVSFGQAFASSQQNVEFNRKLLEKVQNNKRK